MTPQGKPIKASFNDTVAASAWGFESMETWEGREWCYREKSERNLSCPFREDLLFHALLPLYPPHFSDQVPLSGNTQSLGFDNSLPQAQELKHDHTSSAHQALENAPLQENLRKPGKLGGVFPYGSLI